MADLVNTLYEGKILQGDMSIYIGTAKQDLPASVNATADGTLDLSGFTRVDMKDGAVKPVFSQEYNEVVVRESRAPIWYYPEKEGLGLSFKAARADLEALNIAVAGASLTTVSPGAGQVGQTIFNFGDGPVKAVSILLHMLNKDDYYRLYHIPIAIAMENVEQENDRGKQIVTPFNFAACADLTLTAGRRLMRVYDMTALKTS